jgi:sugar lactone lactonase YvrE
MEVEKRGNGRGAGLLLAGLAAFVGALALVPSAEAASGTWERAWGKNVNGGGVFGVCTMAASCLAGSDGELGGEMNNPFGVATDASGNVYVADLTNNRIQKFASSGAWERAWGKNVNGGGVFGVCTMAASCLAGTTGGLGGEMNGPRGVATDAGGNVYVADTLNHRIQKLDSSGTWERAWGKGVLMHGGAGFTVCTAAANCLAGSAGGLGGEMNQPHGVATDADGNVYVADTINHRIQKFDSSGTWERAWGKGVNGGAGFEVCTAAANCLAGSDGGLGGEMFGPIGVATDASGNVYVADAGNNRVQKFDSSGTWERAWGKNVNGGGTFGVCTFAASCLAGTTGGLGGEMSGPVGVATNASNVYVGDSSNHRIQKFASSGTWERAWGKGVNGGAGFEVCTMAASCLAGTFGGMGGEMTQPTGVGTDASGAAYVADALNQRIQRFAPPLAISTQATANATIGGQISDTAMLSGGAAPTGTIGFAAYGPDDATCANAPAYTSNLIPVSGIGNYNSAPAFTPATIGTYRWRAFYSGDAGNAAVATDCNDPNETSVVGAALAPPVVPPALGSPPAAAPVTTTKRKCKKGRKLKKGKCVKKKKRK